MIVVLRAMLPPASQPLSSTATFVMPWLLGQVVGGGQAVPAAADDDHVVGGLGVGVAPEEVGVGHRSDLLHLGVEQGLGGDLGRDTPPEVAKYRRCVPGVASSIGSQAYAIGPPDGVPVGGAGDVADACGPRAVTGSLPITTSALSSGDQLAGDVRRQRVAAEEVLVRPDGEAQPGLVRVVLGGHVDAPEPIALLQPEAGERGPAARRSAGPVRPERVPQLQAQVGAWCRAPSPARRRTRQRIAVTGTWPTYPRLAGEVAEALVRQVQVGQRLDQLPGPRPPHADAAGAGRDVAHVDAAPARAG